MSRRTSAPLPAGENCSMNKNGSVFIVLLLLALIFSACAAPTAAPQPAPSATPQPQTSTASPSSAPAPSATPQPSATTTPSPLPSSSPTLTASSTATITPTSAFTALKIQAAEYRYGGFSIYFVLPGLQQSYRLEVEGTPFACDYKASLPDRLICSGPYFPAKKEVELAFFAPDPAAAEPLFKMPYVVEPLMTATTDPKYIGTDNCPVRGINPKCETENRIADNGKCIVSTCVDSCGYWYSVDTCIYKTPFISPKNGTSIARQLTSWASMTQTAAAKP